MADRPRSSLHRLHREECGVEDGHRRNRSHSSGHSARHLSADLQRCGSVESGCCGARGRDRRSRRRRNLGGFAAFPEQPGSRRGPGDCGPNARGETQSCRPRTKLRRKRTDVAITRRELFSNVAKAGVPAAVALTVGPKALQAEEIPVPSAAVGLLYDASICIGCKACEAACSEANNTPRTFAAIACIRRPRISTNSPATSSSFISQKMALPFLL